MERAGHAINGSSGKSTPSSHPPSNHVQRRTALILYGSETGNSQDVADEVGRMAERLHFDTTVLDMDSVQLRDLLKHSVVIFNLSTTGQGEFPQNARSFWKTLLSGALKIGVLRKVRFSSFGLGDSSYARFNVAHRMLCGRLQQLGAQPFYERGEGNEQHPEGHSAGLREWIVGLRKALLDSFPLPEQVEVIGDDVFLEPKWKLVRSIEHEAKENPNGAALVTNGDAEHRDAPSTALMPVKDAHVARILSNDRVTAADHFQDVRILDLHLPSSINYGPGAVAVVYPKNFPEDVDSFIDLMGWQNIADAPLLLKPNTASNATTDSFSPLRHLDLSNTTLTLRWLLENVLDIMSIPRRSFFSSLSHFVPSNPNEDEAYQKERLLELANPELIDELWDYTTRPKRTILEVMNDFTTVNIPWQYALTALPLIKGRQFSIASGGALTQAPEGGTRVQLLVAIVDPPSPIIKWRRRYGVCTRYIASLQRGQQISIGMQPGYLDVRREEMQVPVVMIGPGTGVAPMRSLVHQRLLWSQTGEVGGLQNDVLILGHRSALADFFFSAEWSSIRRTSGLQVLTAFSREEGKPRQYVQDVIRANAEMIRRAILKKSGKVYVCGSSGNMPKGVREAVVDVLSGDGRDSEQAEGYVDAMEKEGRWKQETW